MSAAFGNLAIGLNATGVPGPVLNLIWPQSSLAIQAEIFPPGTTQCQISIMGQIMGGTYDTLAILDIAQGYVSGQVQPIDVFIPVRNIYAVLTGSTFNGSSVNVYFSGNRLDES